MVSFFLFHNLSFFFSLFFLSILLAHTYTFFLGTHIPIPHSWKLEGIHSHSLSAVVRTERKTDKEKGMEWQIDIPSVPRTFLYLLFFRDAIKHCEKRSQCSASGLVLLVLWLFYYFVGVRPRQSCGRAAAAVALRRIHIIIRFYDNNNNKNNTVMW